MATEKQFNQLSRALFELRCGRAIALDGWAFAAFEVAENVVGEVQVIAPASFKLPLKGTLKAPENTVQELALTLLKRAGMLPVALPVAAAEMQFDVQDLVQALQQESVQLREVARAKLPLKASENAQVVSFRSHNGAAEHLAVIIGNPHAQNAPLVRVHSSCLTGDLLGSLRCDCGDQLQAALQQMTQAGQGVLCYLQQEGRGIGISNKIRAYALQDGGQDTLDANLSLGFDADERDFGLAAAMLKLLDISEITLLSNNPQKKAQLERYGIVVVVQQPLITDVNPHNADYLHTKAQRFGHSLIS